ncbi:response regulator [Undibacterium sp. CY18W]|uniref:Response regulator n=1 Tax=Undibacterium hunanense TaxID=2762292 RepID=A0ABR6ZXY5_9BURK|nr:response regulator [Undibacterium hunanense]MBC3920534.1 response regulator [Undibacterium hunanense]
MAVFSTKNLAQLQAGLDSALPRYSVLIVDDKESNLSVMASVLRDHFHVLEARDGLEAVGIINSIGTADKLACIVSDYRMPRMGGVELFIEAKRLVPLTSRIMVSGYIDVDAVIDSINLGGICKFIVKPYDSQQLLDAVNFAVQQFEVMSKTSVAI